MMSALAPKTSSELPTETTGSLSKSLKILLVSEPANGCLKLNDLLKQNGDGGAYLLMALLSLPFISPIPLPGLSNVIGLIIAWLGLQLVVVREPKLPRFIGERPFSKPSSERIIRYSCRMLDLLEKVIRPRYSRIFAWKPIKIISAFSILIMGVLLALPVPPIVPFSNSLPAWGIIITALATASQDGLLIWMGFTFSMGAFIYFALLAWAAAFGVDKVWQYFGASMRLW